jgi:hypothetical protein
MHIGEYVLEDVGIEFLNLDVRVLIKQKEIMIKLC